MTTCKPLRIAMWSGPRNISTALMRAWENRPDTHVVDEPFYAYYLARSGHAHPGRADVLAAQPNDWQTVVAHLTDTDETGCAIFYQKHMTHHLDDLVSLEWLDGLQNCFLIREPRHMLASLLRVLPDATLPETGLAQQQRLFDHVCAVSGETPPVIDSADVLRDPRAVLGRLCERLSVVFDEQMLHWPSGRRASDGVWAPHWYGSVERSTGFAPWRPVEPVIPADKRALLEQCEQLYTRMRAHCL